MKDVDSGMSVNRRHVAVAFGIVLLAAVLLALVWGGGADRSPAGSVPAVPGAGGGAARVDSPSARDRSARPSAPGVEPYPEADVTEVLPERGLDEGEFLCAAIQFASRLGESERNRAGLIAMTRKAAGRGAKLIVLPETAVQGYASQDHATVWAKPDFGSITTEKSLEGHAETVPGPSTMAFGEVAKEYGCYVSVPVAEHDPKSGNYYNTIAVVGPDGKIACHYRKLVPWTIMEYGWTTPGDLGCGIFETPYGRVGVMICYDIHTVFAMLKERDVDMVMYSVAWVDKNPALWFSDRIRELCERNDAALILANWSTDDELYRNPGFGYSRVVTRKGAVAGKCSQHHGNQIVYAILPKSKAR